MPGRNGTGPMGMGSMTGRGFGACTGVNTRMVGGGFQRGCGRGMGSGLVRDFGLRANTAADQMTSKELLELKKEQLAKMLSAIDEQLESL